jgi:hypothetical protein
MLIEDFQDIISKTIELYESGIDFNCAFFTARRLSLEEKYHNADSTAYEVYLFVIGEMCELPLPKGRGFERSLSSPD